MSTFKIEPPYYPIVYVRGYAMTQGEKEETFHDAYYGFATTSVEKRNGEPRDNKYLLADIFEGQLLRLMKNHRYADAFNRGNLDTINPSRSIWVSRFYDDDYLNGRIRRIEDHATDLAALIMKYIPEELENHGVDLGEDRKDYKVILIAHSMGGLVSRTIIQNSKYLNAYNATSRQVIHRFVTMGTPHRGIDLGVMPDSLERLVGNTLNPFDSGMFQKDRMQEYLAIPNDEYEVHSLAGSDFPIKRCLCLIGSNYKEYNVTKLVTGSFSDGLVKQSNAYLVTGKKPAEGESYPTENTAFFANVHRAHSGYRGIVNSYESYENIQRFLFGNVRADIYLDNFEVNIPANADEDNRYFYDIDFQLSVRGTSTFMHIRKQDPCENAMRFDSRNIPKKILLHTAFMNSALKRDPTDPYLYFLLAFKIEEHHIKERWLWDKEYPGRTIYSESLEIRVGDSDPAQPGDEVQFRWLSEGDDWNDASKAPDKNDFSIPLRPGAKVNGSILISAGAWPDPAITLD